MFFAPIMHLLFSVAGKYRERVENTARLKCGVRNSSHFMPTKVHSTGISFATSFTASTDLCGLFKHDGSLSSYLTF
jgi:hypothetical protein